MKKFASILSLVFIFTLVQSSISFGQQFKIASVDMSKVFDEYYKTKKAQAELKERATACEKELRDQENELKKLGEQIKKLQEDAENPAFTSDKKSENRKLIESKTSEGRIKAQQFNEMIQSRKKELDEQRSKMQLTLVDEITKSIQEKARKEAYSMIVDKTGRTLSGVSSFIYVQDSLDITAEVIKQLNGSAPAASAAPTAGSAAKDIKK
jgi:outer membrane protein